MLDNFVANKGWAYNDIVTPTINYFSNFQTWGAVVGRVRLLAYNEAIHEVALLKNNIFLDPFTSF